MLQPNSSTPINFPVKNFYISQLSAKFIESKQYREATSSNSSVFLCESPRAGNNAQSILSSSDGHVYKDNRKNWWFMKKNITTLTVEKLEFPFWVLHYAQNLPQNQTYPSTSKWREKKRGRERDKFKSTLHKYKLQMLFWRSMTFH